jgi:hypothetical protein
VQELARFRGFEETLILSTAFMFLVMILLIHFALASPNGRRVGG